MPPAPTAACPTADLGGGDLHVRPAVVVEGEQRIAGGVDRQTIILGRAEAAIRHQHPVVSPLLDAVRVEPLEINVVAAIGIVEPAEVAAAVGGRHDLRLHLLIGAVGDAEVRRRIARELGVGYGGEEKAGEEARDNEKAADLARVAHVPSVLLSAAPLTPCEGSPSQPAAGREEAPWGTVRNRAPANKRCGEGRLDPRQDRLDSARQDFQ